MIYLLIKAAHITSVTTFIGGLLMLSVSIGTSNLVVQRTVRRWDRRVTFPALALVWITGLTIALQGHWFGDWWLTIKLILVAGLSGLHGVLSGTIRRMERDGMVAAPAPFRKAGAVTIATMGMIALLVMIKHI